MHFLLCSIFLVQSVLFVVFETPPNDESFIELPSEEPRVPDPVPAAPRVARAEHDRSSGGAGEGSLPGEVKGTISDASSNPNATTELSENEIDEGRYRGMPAAERVLNILGGQIIDEIIEQPEGE